MVAKIQKKSADQRNSSHVSHSLNIREDLKVYNKIAALLRNISDEVRLAIVLTLGEEEEMSVVALCAVLSQSQPALGHYLALLRHAGIISPQRRGKNNYYRLTDHGLRLFQVAHTLLEMSLGPSEASADKTIPDDLIADVQGFVDDPVCWFHANNPEFEGRKPFDLLGTPEEARLRNRILAARLGLFS